MAEQAIKACSGCDLPKGPDEFAADGRRKDGRGAKCLPCVRAAREVFYAKHPEKRGTHRDSSKRASAAWYLRNRVSQLERNHWNRALRLYGITREDYEQMLREQAGTCAICGATEPGRTDQHFAVDHDHSSGRVRALLCQRCNSGLGFFSERTDLLRRAASYLEERSQPS